MSDAPGRGSGDRPGLPELSEPDARLASLTDAVRRLSVGLLHTDADPAGLQAARDAVDRIERGLRPRGDAAEADDPLNRSLYMYNPVEGLANVAAPPMRTTVQRPGDIVAELMLTRLHGGPAGRSHGGWVAAILDQAMGHAIVSAGSTSLTMTLQVSYSKGTPLGVPLRVRAVCGPMERRALTVRASLGTADELCASATGLFLIPHTGVDDVRAAVDALAVDGVTIAP